MISFPNAKINLGLRIIRKREDGFHDLETVFYPVPLCDILEIVEVEYAKEKIFTKQIENPFSPHEVEMESGKKIIFTCSGLIVENDVSKNLCVKACNLFDHLFQLPFNIAMHLHKIIPMGAGLGGGSSDATHVLKMLNQLTGFGVSENELFSMAESLGSDCPFFLENKPLFATGKGEILTPVDVSLTGLEIVIVKPAVHVSTSDAFGGIIPRDSKDELKDHLKLPFDQWSGWVKNDFEHHIFEKYPEIKKLKNKLIEKGALFAAMSGSGSSLFGLFKKNAPVKSEFPGIFYFHSVLK